MNKDLSEKIYLDIFILFMEKSKKIKREMHGNEKEQKFYLHELHCSFMHSPSRLIFP